MRKLFPSSNRGYGETFAEMLLKTKRLANEFCEAVVVEQ
jgi:hypothetical protein